MNYIFISPHFPVNYYNFIPHLRSFGFNVLGIADEDFERLRPELKYSLTEYYKVSDLHNYEELVKAIGFFIFKYGKIRRPFLGVRYFILNEDIAKIHNLPVNFGALVVRESFGEPAIVKDSPAEKAGLKEYDIILEINNEKITQDNPLADVLQKHKIGEEIEIKVLRDGKEIILKTKITEKNTSIWSLLLYA